MTRKCEVDRILTFVRDQRSRVNSYRQWKSRLAVFGFAIEETEDGPMISKLPKQKIVCPVPAELRA